jgi:hypothetical protein
VVFLGFSDVISTYKKLVPVSVLTKDVRVDLKSVVWMLGKLLRGLAFVHDQGFTVGLLDATNVLVETDLHGVFVLDFSGASEEPSDADCLAEVFAAAKLAWEAAGGTDTKAPLLDPDIMNQDQHDEFVEFLRSMMDNPSRAQEERADLYAMADRIWPKETGSDDGVPFTKRPFHPFCTYTR